MHISTHSLTRRLTQIGVPVQISDINFNSQPHKEADTTATLQLIFSIISTHSLTRRLTNLRRPEILHRKHFNSQPHKEADIFMVTPPFRVVHFNSQPHKEADGYALPFESITAEFQLTASQGG